LQQQQFKDGSCSASAVKVDPVGSSEEQELQQQHFKGGSCSASAVKVVSVGSSEEQELRQQHFKGGSCSTSSGLMVHCQHEFMAVVYHSAAGDSAA
jgi:hypothetical protein